MAGSNCKLHDLPCKMQEQSPLQDWSGGLLSTTMKSTPWTVCTRRSRTDRPNQRRYSGCRVRPRTTWVIPYSLTKAAMVLMRSTPLKASDVPPNCRAGSRVLPTSRWVAALMFSGALRGSFHGKAGSHGVCCECPAHATLVLRIWRSPDEPAQPAQSNTQLTGRYSD